MLSTLRISYVQVFMTQAYGLYINSLMTPKGLNRKEIDWKVARNPFNWQKFGLTDLQTQEEPKAL